MHLKKGRYQHYKGNFYQVLDVVRHSETEELLVLYQQLYGDGSRWVRPFEHFCEIVLTEDGQVARFAYVDKGTKSTSESK